MNKTTFFLLTLLLVFSTQLSGCVPRPPLPPTPTLSPLETDIPFERIARSDVGVKSVGEEPTLLILSSPEELLEIESWLKPADLADVQKVDWNRYAVIALFRGWWRACSGYGVTIERLTLAQDSLYVHAVFWGTKGGCAPAPYSPYHLVIIEKKM